MSLDRRPFPTDAAHAPLLRLLLAQDGSTTRVCEAVAGAAVRVVLHRQSSTRDVPLAVRQQLGGTAWLERITSLVDGSNAVMMDNLSYTRLDAVPSNFLEALEAGSAPIGHLLTSLFVQREAVPGSDALRQRLWDTVGEADDRASRSYRIVTAQGPLMLIFEVFRASMCSGMSSDMGSADA